MPAGTRDHASQESTFNYTGFRVIMYKEVLSTQNSNRLKIAAGREHSLYLDDLGNIWAWGNNSRGQLGQRVGIAKATKPIQITDYETNQVKFIEIQTDADTTLALDEQGAIWGCGHTSDGQLGDGTYSSGTTERNEYVFKKRVDKTEEGIKFTTIASGEEHSFALDNKGNIWGCGYNRYGTLGDGTSSTTAINKLKQITNCEESGIRFIQIVAGNNHGVALDERGNIWAWGSNSSGQLGDGTTTTSRVPKQITNYEESTIKFTQIAASGNYSLAIDEKGNIWSWGANSFGQLGDGTKTTSKVPKQITNYEGNVRFTQIASASDHALALDEQGNIWLWGHNNKGQLGNGTTEESLVPKQMTNDEKLKFMQISAGGNHSLALDERGNIWSWGFNSFGQLGDETTQDSLIPKKIYLQ